MTYCKGNGSAKCNRCKRLINAINDKAWMLLPEQGECKLFKAK